MEEDIKEDLSSIAFSHPFFSDIVVNALNYIEKLEKESDSKEKAYNNCYYEFKHYKQYKSIPVSKVKEKIEELEKEYKQIESKYEEEVLDAGEEDLDDYIEMEKIRKAKRVLQELMEDK